MKKVAKNIINVLSWVILIFALLITILVFSSERNNGVPNLLGIMPMSVQSESMKPTFKKGDLIFVKQVDLYDLKVEDTITFYTIVDGNRIMNTHRIVEINEDSGVRTFITKGDNNPVNDTSIVYASDIIGRWNCAKLPGGGKALDFLRSKTGFFICIVIPLAAFFIFELYKFIVVLIESKKPSISKEDEEEIKKKAIEEYLAKEKAEKEVQVSDKVETPENESQENNETETTEEKPQESDDIK